MSSREPVTFEPFQNLAGGSFRPMNRTEPCLSFRAKPRNPQFVYPLTNPRVMHLLCHLDRSEA